MSATVISTGLANAAAVTPSDSTPLPNPALALWIGGAGNVTVITAAGQTVTFSSVAAGTMLWVQATLIGAINKDVRSQAGYGGPGGSWLSDAKRMYDEWEMIFRVNPKDAPYDSYRRVFTSSLPAKKKDVLRRELEEEKLTQKALRQRLRDMVDAERGISRPDFDLKLGNSWRFDEKNRRHHLIAHV